MKGDAIDSTELSKLSDAQLLKKLETTSVLSRVEPSDKLRVVDLLKSQ